MVRHRSVRSESQEEPGLAHTPHGELGGEHGRSVAVLTLGGGREYGQVTVTAEAAHATSSHFPETAKMGTVSTPEPRRETPDATLAL